MQDNSNTSQTRVRRRGKRNSPAMKYVTRFRLQPTHHESSTRTSNLSYIKGCPQNEEDESNPSPKIFHWKYNEREMPNQESLEGPLPYRNGLNAPMSTSFMISDMSNNRYFELSPSSEQRSMHHPETGSSHAKKWLEPHQTMNSKMSNMNSNTLNMNSNTLNSKLSNMNSNTMTINSNITNMYNNVKQQKLGESDPKRNPIQLAPLDNVEETTHEVQLPPLQQLLEACGIHKQMEETNKVKPNNGKVPSGFGAKFYQPFD